VRTENEWEQKRIAGSVNIPLNRLAERSGELPHDRPIVVHCGTGYRSSIATSLLQGQGFGNTIDLVGGFNAWEKCCPSNVVGNS
jgi:rhodanese-related sulfurtransferase